MKKRKPVNQYLIISALCLVFFVSNGCTKNQEQQAEKPTEKGRIDQITDEAAEEAVRKIRTPIDKARSTGDMGDDRLEAMDKALQQQ